VLYARVHERAEQAGYKVVRNYVGEYCTSLEMAGASVTILRLDDELEKLLAAPAECAARIF
jgi:dihydroxyacetone kinase-like protein